MTKHKHDSEPDTQRQETGLTPHAAEGSRSARDPASAAKSEQTQSATKEEQAEGKRLAKEQRKLVERHLRRELALDEKELKRLKKRLKAAAAPPQRGIETWFRLASRNLYTRRQIVDSKASILVTVNVLIMSVVLGTVYQNLGDDPHLVYAVVPLVLANLISIAFAILASKPKLQRGVFSEQDLRDHRVSLMTFDDFHAMTAEEYEQALDRIMQDRSLLYGTIKRDIYRLGVDLSHRYIHIQRAYGIFLFGIVLATVVFGMCHAIFG